MGAGGCGDCVVVGAQATRDVICADAGYLRDLPIGLLKKDGGMRGEVGQAPESQGF